MISQLQTRATVAGSVLPAVVCCVSLALTCTIAIHTHHIHNQLVISEDVSVVITSFILKHHYAGACHS